MRRLVSGRRISPAGQPRCAFPRSDADRVVGSSQGIGKRHSRGRVRVVREPAVVAGLSAPVALEVEAWELRVVGAGGWSEAEWASVDESAVQRPVFIN